MSGLGTGELGTGDCPGSRVRHLCHQPLGRQRTAACKSQMGFDHHNGCTSGFLEQVSSGTWPDASPRLPGCDLLGLVTDQKCS